jgi:hypothetical protein
MRRPEVSAGPVAATAAAPASSAKRFVILLAAVVALSAGVNHLLSYWLGLAVPAVKYRRVGPTAGPQVFVAGSSLLQFGLSWPELSEFFGKGMENWGLGGSSPEIWELTQPGPERSTLMIVGISLYDLNEFHLAEARANVVPFSSTLRDLSTTTPDPVVTRRILGQYPLAYLRFVYPAAGQADAAMVAVRRWLRASLSLAGAEQDRATALVLPTDDRLHFGESSERIADWDRGRTLRRLSLMRAESRGQHTFDGPKRAALHRMITKAAAQGDVVIVVMPVAQAYRTELVTPDVTARFEEAVQEAQRLSGDGRVVRLDQVPDLGTDEHFSDFVHLNSEGRRLATARFLDAMREHPLAAAAAAARH